METRVIVGRRLMAVVLAAGMSRRMGVLKMLLPFGDKPMLGRVIESLQAGGAVSSIIAVTGYARQEIEGILAEYGDVACVYNACFESGGMLSSVKAGVAALPDACDAILLVLGDQPMVKPSTIELLRAAWTPGAAQIIAPSYRGTHGHPVLITGALVREILSLGAEDTLRTLVQRHSYLRTTVSVEDQATVHDIDTPGDYEAALRRWREVEA